LPLVRHKQSFAGRQLPTEFQDDFIAVSSAIQPGTLVVNVLAVPEPSSSLLLVLGSVTLVLGWRGTW
jgi:hypothetical protein